MEHEKGLSSSAQKSSVLPALLGTLSFVLGALVFSKLRTPANRADDSIDPYTASEKPYNSRKNLTPLPYEVPPTPNDPKNPCECCHHKTPRWKILLDILLTLGTLGAFGAAGYYGYISHNLWGEMKNQTCIQRETATNAERAWVGLAQSPQVENVTPLTSHQFTAQVVLAVKNFGKGPAFNVFADAFFTTHGHVQQSQMAACNLIFPYVGLTPTMPTSSSQDISKTQWGFVLYPGQPPYSEGVNVGGESGIIVGQEVFLVGCIVYKDQFGNPHWARFSYSTGPFASQVVKNADSFKRLYISNANNYTDDEEKKQGCPVTAIR